MFTTTQASGYYAAPVTKLLIGSITLLSLLASIYRLQPYAVLSFDPHLIRDFQLYRLATSQLIVTSSYELFLVGLLLHELRGVERMLGAAKYASIVFTVMVVFAPLLQVGFLAGIWYWNQSNQDCAIKVNGLPPGSIVLLTALIVIRCSILPVAYRFRVFGVVFSERIFMYLLLAQLVILRAPLTIVQLSSGVMVGVMYSYNMLYMKRWIFPQRLQSWAQLNVLNKIVSFGAVELPGGGGDGLSLNNNRYGRRPVGRRNDPYPVTIMYTNVTNALGLNAATSTTATPSNNSNSDNSNNNTAANANTNEDASQSQDQQQLQTQAQTQRQAQTQGSTNTMRTSTRQQQHMYPFQERFDRSPTQTRRGIQERSSFLSAFGAFRSPPSQHQQHHQQQQQQYQQQSTSTLTGSGASNNNHRASLRSLTWQIPLQQDELGQTTSTATNPAVSSLSRRRSSGAFSESSLTEYSDDEIDYTYLPSDYLNNGFRLPPSPLPADAIDHPLAFFNVPSPSSASIRTGGRASSSMAPSIAESRISSIYNLPRASGDSASISNISTRPMFHGRFGDRQATAATTTTTTTTTTSGSITSNIPNSSASSLHRRGRSMSSLHSLFTSSEDSSNPFNFNAPPQQPASSSTSTVRQPQPSLQTMSTTSVATTGDHYSSAESPTVVRSPISPVATMRSYVDAFTNSAADADESRSSSTEPQIDAFGFTNAVRDNPLRRRSSIPTNQQISSSIRSMRSMFPNISRQRIVEVLQESDYDATRAVSVLLDE